MKNKTNYMALEFDIYLIMCTDYKQYNECLKIVIFHYYIVFPILSVHIQYRFNIDI
jgi:hypothetical protein